ncbi:MAG TPA: AI-2E family transporter, partial [Kouleothrix sp.]|nr:AI-2E family transporter [Kouleothrix sp.]
MPQSISVSITAKGVALLLAALALVWLIANFSSILLILFVAILLAVAITPAVAWLSAQRVPRAVAIVLIYLALLGLLSVVVAVTAPVLIDEVNQLSDNLPSLTTAVVDAPGSWLGPLFPSLQQSFKLNDLAQQLSAQLGALVGSVGALLVGLGRTLTSLILNGLLVLVVGFILTADAEFAPRFIARFFPPSYRPTAAQLAGQIGDRLGHWVRAQLLVCVFYGVCFGIGLALMGVPYAFALGLAAAFMELIPYVGGAIVTGLAILVALSVSPWLALGVLVLYLVIANVEANIVYPKVVGEIVGLHPLVIIIALFIGAEARGVMGALLAVPFTVVLQVLFDQFYRFEERAPAAATAEAPVLPREPAAPAPLAATLLGTLWSWIVASSPRQRIESGLKSHQKLPNNTPCQSHNRRRGAGINAASRIHPQTI